MELCHLFTAHIIILSSFASIILFSDSTRYAYILRYISTLPVLRTSGEKAAILIFFALSMFFLVIIDFVSSQAKISGLKQVYKRAKAAKQIHMQCILTTLISFISAHIFQALNFRIYNLLGLALAATNMKSIQMLFGASFLGTWLYLTVIFCNFVILGFTFISNFEKYYLMAISFIGVRF